MIWIISDYLEGKQTFVESSQCDTSGSSISMDQVIALDGCGHHVRQKGVGFDNQSPEDPRRRNVNFEF